MKFCLSSRQQKSYIDKADEIKVAYRDREEIPDLFEQYPNKMIILYHTIYDDELDWEQLKIWNILSKGQFMLCVATTKDCLLAKENNIKFFLGFPISSWEMFNALVDLGVSYVRLDAPLFFDLERVSDYNIPIRVIPNVAHMDHLLYPDGVTGTWIRPEDIDAYAEYVEAVEFEDCDPQKERALFRIYAEEKEWPGDLDYLITNLKYPGSNRVINPESSRRRITCRQTCTTPTGFCKLCYRMLDLADLDKLKDYAAAMEKKKEAEEKEVTSFIVEEQLGKNIPNYKIVKRFPNSNEQ